MSIILFANINNAANLKLQYKINRFLTINAFSTEKCILIKKEEKNHILVTGLQRVIKQL